MKKILFLLAIAVWHCGQTMAQTFVRDQMDRSPVVYAAVFGEGGDFLGSTDVDGKLPPLKAAAQVRISHMAYKEYVATTDTLGAEILLTPNVYELKEVVYEKPEDYCMKITGYFRCCLLNEDTTKDVFPPLFTFTDGIGTIYLFNNNTLKVDHFKNIVVRNYLKYGDRHPKYSGAENVVSNFYGFDSKVEQIKYSKKLELRSEGKEQHIYRKGVRVGVLKTDSTTGTIQMDYDKLAPDSTFKVNLIAMKLVITDWKTNTLYRLSPYGRVSLADMISLHETRRTRGKIFKESMKAWELVDFYPISVEYMTKEEYKSEKKEGKEQGYTLANQDIDNCMEQLGVPAIAPELQRKIEEANLWYDSHQKKE